MEVYLPREESKEIGPHITTKEELDALYKNIETTISGDEKTNILSDNSEN